MTPSIYAASHNTKSFIERDYRKKTAPGAYGAVFAFLQRKSFSRANSTISSALSNILVTKGG
jgi:hypothetical protein